ncbi:MAG: alpha/beta fold hydrolase [Acidimicrobiia bacterium]
MAEPARPWGELFAFTVDRLSTTVEEMHTAIVRPWFRMAGPAESELRGAYISAASGVYRSVRAVASIAGRVTDIVRGGSQTEPTRRSDAVQAFANAVWGDEMERRGSSMAIGMGVRDRSGVIVDLDPSSLAEAFPDASGRLVVLLHGLGQTERCFSPSGTTPGLAEALASSSFTPVLVRYNSGRAVAVNGRDLSALLEEVVARWPVPVTELALVGHSMGGLVGRAAIASGRSNAGRWVGTVRHVVTIATPHAGSPIEKGVEATFRALMVAPQTRALGGFLAQRSEGIRDLHSGAHLPPTFAGINLLVIASVMTEDVSHPIGSLFGDLVVTPGSATGGGRVVANDKTLIGGRRHHEILADPSIPDRILEWIEPA